MTTAPRAHEQGICAHCRVPQGSTSQACGFCTAHFSGGEWRPPVDACRFCGHPDMTFTGIFWSCPGCGATYSQLLVSSIAWAPPQATGVDALAAAVEEE